MNGMLKFSISNIKNLNFFIWLPFNFCPSHVLRPHLEVFIFFVLSLKKNPYNITPPLLRFNFWPFLFLFIFYHHLSNWYQWTSSIPRLYWIYFWGILEVFVIQKWDFTWPTFLCMVTLTFLIIQYKLYSSCWVYFFLLQRHFLSACPYFFVGSINLSNLLLTLTK